MMALSVSPQWEVGHLGSTVMVRYVLRCHKDHTIEAWFRSEDQRKSYLAAKDQFCPVCELEARRAEVRFQADAPAVMRPVRH